MEGVSGSGVGSHHDLAIRWATKKLLAAARPPGEPTTRGGVLRLAPWAGEWPHVHFEVPGLVGAVGEPAAIWRESSIHFVERAVQKGLWLPRLPAGLLVAFDGQRQDIPGAVGGKLRVRQDLAIGAPGVRVLLVLAFG